MTRTSTTTPIITIHNNHFYNHSTSTRFIVRGLVYQIYPPRQPPFHSTTTETEHSTDPLDDTNHALLVQNIPLFKSLNINTLWIYTINPAHSHTKSMTLLSSAGIYVIFSPTAPFAGGTIHRSNPTESYTVEVKTYFEKVVGCMLGFENVLGVCVASSLVNDRVRDLNVVREIHEVMGRVVGDLRRFMRGVSRDSKRKRVLPVCVDDDGWAALNASAFDFLVRKKKGGMSNGGGSDSTNTNVVADAATGGEDGEDSEDKDKTMAPSKEMSVEQQKHDDDEDETPDFYTFVNFTSWPRGDINNDHHEDNPSNNTKQPSRSSDPGREKLEKLIAKFDDVGAEKRIPVLVSQYGSNVVRPRTWSEIDTLYSAAVATTTTADDDDGGAESVDDSLGASVTTDKQQDQKLRDAVQDTLSGGFVYEFYEGPNGYGLVKRGRDGEVEMLPDFYSLKEKLSRID